MPDEAVGGAGRPRKKSPSATDCEFQIVKVEDIRNPMKMTISKLVLNFLIFLSFFTVFFFRIIISALCPLCLIFFERVSITETSETLPRNVNINKEARLDS